MMSHAHAKLLDALKYVAGRKCANCAPADADKSPTPCSHDAARQAVADFEALEAWVLSHSRHKR